jgi:hypothetical protein
MERPRPPLLAASAAIAPRYASPNRPLLFFYNAGGMHWCFVRVTLGLRKRIELYEPMGKPPAKAAAARAANVYRADGLSLRAVPRHLIEWLDAVCPLETEGGWKERSLSAITRQHQINGFDCGVACLLYAEKSAQGLEAETICEQTGQHEITSYRKLLVDFVGAAAAAAAGGARGGGRA